jgi:hypothetical protein
MCGHKLQLVSSFRAPDRMVDGVIVQGETFQQWQTCAQKRGHEGPHGGYARGYLPRLRISNWIDP